MQSLANLIPDNTTNNVWVPRPASISKTDFLVTLTGDTHTTDILDGLASTDDLFIGMTVTGPDIPDTPATTIIAIPGGTSVQLSAAADDSHAGGTYVFDGYGFMSALLVVGNTAYGMIASELNAGKDQPWVYDLAASAFIAIDGITADNVPTSPATSGAWVPPIARQVGSRIIFCHPGFTNPAYKFGWLDISGFSLAQTGDTHTSTLVDNLASTVGIQPGMLVVDSAGDIPADTTVVSTTATTITLSAAATGSTAGDTITVTGGTPSAPLWGAGDTNLNNLPSAPVCVQQFNGRAYFGLGPNGVGLSDALLPCQITDGTQFLTTNDGLDVTMIGPLMLQNALVGGIVQALIVFQGVNKMQQITGDPATSNLSMNAMPVATGTDAPLTVVPSELGLAFVSPHGLRIVTGLGTVTPVIGDAGSGVSVPFIFSSTPSRMCAAAGDDVIRITTINGAEEDTPTEEYFWDVGRKVWSGPHSFGASLIQPWGKNFLLSAAGIDAHLWSSAADADNTATYVENGVQLTWTFWPSLFPDNQGMAANSVVEMAVMMGLPSGQNIVCVALDEAGNIIDQTNIAGPSIGTTTWGSFTWGAALWGGALSPMRQVQIPWTRPLVFKQMSTKLVGSSIFGTRMGNLYGRYEILGYLLPPRS